MTASPGTDRRAWLAALGWPAGFAAVVMALTCLPYLYGLLIRPEDAYYSGLLTNPDEHNVYLAYMKQAAEGRVFLIDPFTSEPQAGRVVNVFFLSLGLFSRISGASLPVTYHLARLVSGWLLLIALAILANQAIADGRSRRTALGIAAFASGLGWLFTAAPGQPHPIDYGPGLVMPEAVTFLSLLLNPLFCFSMVLMVAAIGLGAHALRTGSLRSAALAGGAALILGNIHTYDVLPVAGTLAAYALLLLGQRRLKAGALAAAGVAAAVAAPSLLYQLWLLRSGEVTLAIKAAETPVYSPAPFHLALGLGLPLALAVFGIARAARPGGSETARLLALWLVLGFALVYAPVPFQRKLAQGLHLPVALLAAYALEPVLSLPRIWAAPLAALVVVAAAPSNLLFSVRACGDLQTNNQAYLANLMPPLYLRADQLAAMDWLDEHASFDDIVLCNSFLGSYAPSLGGVRVYVGHWAETLRFPEKLRGFREFLDAQTPDERRTALVRQEEITYLLRDRSIYDDISLLGPDGSLRPAFDLAAADWLAPVWEGGQTSVHRVIER